MMQLKDKPDFSIADSGKLSLIESGDVPAVKQHPAGGGMVKSANDIKQRAFAAAGRPDYYNGLAVLDP
jgi:hypothetical protein